MIDDWNVVVIAEQEREKELLKEFGEDEGGVCAGEFESSGFSDVLVGYVADVVDFLEDVEQQKYRYVSRVIPIDDAFVAPSEHHYLIDMLKNRVARYIDIEITPGETLGFRVEQIGVKEDIPIAVSSQKIEREVGEYFYGLIEKVHGRKPKTSIKKQDKLIAVVIIGNRCGIGLITREMQEKYSVIKVK
ncbi:MAG: hypothetical protein H0M93_04925 [Methanophagales archaeon]|nr:hypothetical protein [Methanophagales archaeon]